jgi:hypothetical protein
MIERMGWANAKGYVSQDAVYKWSLMGDAIGWVDNGDGTWGATLMDSLNAVDVESLSSGISYRTSDQKVVFPAKTNCRTYQVVVRVDFIDDIDETVFTTARIRRADGSVATTATGLALVGEKQGLSTVIPTFTRNAQDPYCVGGVSIDLTAQLDTNNVSKVTVLIMQ